MTKKIAFIGFRHSHINGFYNMAQESDLFDVVAVCEEDEAARKSLESQGISFTHDNYEKLLEEIDCGIVAVGDYYAKHGSIIISALKAGKHVIADKPICTNIDELIEIEKLAIDKNLAVGCMFDLRCSGNFIKLKELIDSGEIGDVITISIEGQHPLSLESRPKWYFEPGMHGGTINDIGIHAVDMALWLTGGDEVDILMGKEWNAKARQFQNFKDAAQFMIRIDNSVGVIVDVSYLAPSKVAYSSNNYWRVTVHGEKGFLETSYTMPNISIANDEDEEIRDIPKMPDKKFVYIDDFLNEIEGCGNKNGLTTKAVLTATEQTLLIQNKTNFKN